MNFTDSKVDNLRMKASETLLNATDIESVVDELFKEIRGMYLFRESFVNC